MTAQILKSDPQCSLFPTTRSPHAKGLLFACHGPDAGAGGFVRITLVTYLFIDPMLGPVSKIPYAGSIARTLCTADHIDCGFVFRTGDRE